MSQNGNDLMLSIAIASPVLLAAALSVVLAVSAILNPTEDTSSDGFTTEEPDQVG
ncbi:MAG: hypothetical protein V3T68_00115 [Dehalococcoidales bacterium]